MKKILLIFMMLSMLIFSGCSQDKPTSSFAVVDGKSFENVTLKNIPQDHMGNKGKFTIFSDAVVAQKHDDVAVQFQYNIAPFDVNTETIDTGLIFQNNSQAVITSGTGLNAEAHIESFESIRYSPGKESFALYTVAFVTGGVVGVEQLTGAYNEDEDGFVIGFNGTELITGLIKSGVKDFTPKSLWLDPLNGSGLSGCNLNFSQLHQYRISYGWLGISPITFEIYCDFEIGWVNFNTIDKSNMQTTPTINNPVLPIQMHIIKTNSSTEVQMVTSSWNGGSIGGSPSIVRPGTRIFAEHRSKTIPANILTNLITVRSNETFFGKTNRIESLLQNLNVGVEGTKIVEIYILRNANVTGLNLTQVDANNSVSFVDFDGTLVTGGDILDVIVVQKTGTFDKDLKKLDIDFHKGETITIAAISTGTSDVVPTLRWEEEF